MRSNKKGFTLIELLVVMIIVAILASVAVPMMTGITKRAIATEAITILGHIWNAENAYYLNYGNYAETMMKLQWAGYLRLRDGINPAGEIDGIYFSQETFLGGASSSPPYRLYHTCYPNDSLEQYAPKASQVKNWPTKIAGPRAYIGMDQNRKIYSNIKGLGYDSAPIPL